MYFMNSEAIKRVRLELGYSQQEFAAAIGVSFATVNRWENGKAKLVKLDSLKRTPLLTYYLSRNTNGFNEARYHMCDEPFDYRSWKTGSISKAEVPSIKAIGTDSRNMVVMEVNVPDKGDVFVDILNSQGEVVWRMHADDLEPGTHQVVWDGFSQPGMYNMYVKGMDWDAEREVVIYT